MLRYEDQVKKKKLTPKQEIFVNEYLTNGFNATQACKTAGYKSPRVQGQENLLKPAIREIIEKHQQKVRKKYDIKKEEIIEDLVDIVRSDISKIITVEKGKIKIKNKVDPKDLNMLESISVTKTRGEKSDSDAFNLKRQDRAKALDTLIKLAGLDGSGKETNKKDWETIDNEISDALEEYQE